MSNLFKKAEKKAAKLRLGITGPSGSGKTFSALRMAKGMYGKTAVIDTERGSASLYSDKFDFDVLELTPPYSTEKYMDAIEAAEKAGYEILIIDSISHAWSGEGGLLNQKEQMDARGGNSFQNWAKMTPKQEKFINRILASSMHIILTMRSKQDYVMEVNSNGKQAPKKVGLAPVQREGFEYELTTVFDAGMTHEVAVSKDRTGLFVDKIFMITEATGIELKEWVNSGKSEPKDVSASHTTVSAQHILANPYPVEPKYMPAPPIEDIKGQAELGGPYIIPANMGKLSGKNILDCDPKDLEGSIKYWENRAAKEGKALTGKVADFVARAKYMLEQLEEPQEIHESIVDSIDNFLGRSKP